MKLRRTRLGREHGVVDDGVESPEALHGGRSLGGGRVVVELAALRDEGLVEEEVGLHHAEGIRGQEDPGFKGLEGEGRTLGGAGLAAPPGLRGGRSGLPRSAVLQGSPTLILNARSKCGSGSRPADPPLALVACPGSTHEQLRGVRNDCQIGPAKRQG